MPTATELPDVLDKMTVRDIALTLLYLKPGGPIFHEEAFYDVMKEVTADHPQLSVRMFAVGSDGTSPGGSSSLERTLNLAYNSIVFLSRNAPSARGVSVMLGNPLFLASLTQLCE